MRPSKILPTFENQENTEDEYVEWGLEEDEWGLEENEWGIKEDSV